MRKSIHLIFVSLVWAMTLTLVVVGASPARAADLYVPSAGYSTIQAAINAAASSGDTIHVAAGEYSEGLTIIGKSLSIVGAGADQTFLDGGGEKRVVRVHAGANVTFSELTIQNGYTSEASNPQWRGGGIYNEGEVTANNCTFTNNKATGDGGSGAAIYNYNGGKVTAHNCTFTNNKASADGGAIDSYRSQGFTGGFPSVTCTNCVFTGNAAASCGGAISSVVYGSGASASRPTVITVTNCTFTGNYAESSGGAVYFWGGELKATNCTLSANHINSDSHFGGGIFAARESNMPETVATVTNCILWGNTYGWYTRDWNQMYIQDDSSAVVTYSDVQGGCTGTGNLDDDPRFARNPDPADNDYSDNDCGDLHLQYINSPCIDKGDNNAVTAPPFLTDPDTDKIIDLDGNQRIQNSVVNMGAYESLSPAANAGEDQENVGITHDGDPATNTAQVTLNGSGSDPDGLSLTYHWWEGATDLGEGKNLPIGLPDGTHTISLTVTATDGDMSEDQVNIQVLSEPNEWPVADAGPEQMVATNPVALDGSGSYDPDGDQLTYKWYTCVSDKDKGYDCTELATGMNPSVSLSLGEHMVRLIVSDPYEYTGFDDILVTVLNTAPAVGAITINPAPPCPANTPLSAAATFTDPDPDETHTALWDWGDGSTPTGTVDEGSGSVSGSHTYAADGTYTVTLTVTDANGGTGSSSCQYVVQSNRPSSFVTGGGWITSPAGAYRANPSLTGKATFGFNSKYTKGANVPSGSTEFQLKAANLNFHSERYEWLTVTGAKAQYKGTGTINGRGNYGFMLTAIDGAVKGGRDIDKFRIKIWDNSNNGLIVYDNQPGDSDTSDPTTVIGGGSIIIHKN